MGEIKKGKIMVAKELDFIYIAEDGERFLTRQEAEKHEKELNSDNYKIFNR